MVDPYSNGSMSVWSERRRKPPRRRRGPSSAARLLPSFIFTIGFCESQMYVIKSAVPPPTSATRKDLFIVKQTRAINGRAVSTLVLLPLLPHDRMLRQLQARKYQIRIRESCVSCCVDHSVLDLLMLVPQSRHADCARDFVLIKTRSRVLFRHSCSRIFFLA